MAITLAPWCAAMGATFPFAMKAVRARFSAESSRSFSYLYVANLGGAALGTAIPLLLIEELGFRGTLRIGLALNLCLALCAFGLAFKLRPGEEAAALPESLPEESTAAQKGNCSGSCSPRD